METAQGGETLGLLITEEAGAGGSLGYKPIPSMVVYEVHGDSPGRERPENFSRTEPMNRGVFAKWTGWKPVPLSQTPAGQFKTLMAPHRLRFMGESSPAFRMATIPVVGWAQRDEDD